MHHKQHCDRKGLWRSWMHWLSTVKRPARKIGFWYARRSDKNLSVCDDTRFNGMSRCSVEPQVQVNSAKALIPQFPHTCESAPNFRCPSFAFIFQFDKGSLKKETFCRFTINNAESKTANWVNTTQNTHFLCAVFVQRRSNIKLTYKTDISSVTQRYNDNGQKYICLIGSSHTYELPQTKDSWLLDRGSWPVECNWNWLK